MFQPPEARHHESAAMQSSVRHWCDPRLANVTAVTAIVCATALAALLLSHPQGGVFQAVVMIAAWMRGATMPNVVTWPAWGYAGLVAFLASFRWVLVIQAGTGVLALAALLANLRRIMPEQALLLGALCAFALPWHYIQVTLYPSAFAGSFCLFALLAVDRALVSNQSKWGLIAGGLMGLAQNFRTELVMLPLFLLVCSLALKRLGLLKARSLRPMSIFVVIALLLQLPWAMFYHAHTGRYSLMESNFGHVLYVSLGSQPINPWGIRGDDAEAEKAVHDLGYSFSSLSDQGSRVLVHLTIDKIKQHPSGLIDRTLQQLRNTVLAPFNWGEPVMAAKHAKNLDVLRQEMKARLGVGVNVAKLDDDRNRDLYSEATQDRVALVGLLYQVLTVGVGSILFVLTVLGLLIVLCRPAQWLATPLVWLCGLVVLYKVGQNVLLFYQVNYLNSAYPMFLPFVAISLTSIIIKMRRQLHLPSHAMH